MRLSILVPSVYTRFSTTSLAVQESLFDQYKALSFEDQSQVEIIVLTDTKARTIGRKRQDMIEMAQGDYVAFVDDDDRIDLTYLKRLLAATEGGKDVITFTVLVSLNGQRPKPCFYSLTYTEDRNWPESYQRLPNHIMCVKRKHALAAGFDDMGKGEDSAYAKRLRPFLETETQIARPLYLYDFNSQTTETQR